jgi:hypothetical protein
MTCVQCGIPEAGGLALFRALARGNSTLRVLSLNNNSIGNKSASALGELLSVNFALQVSGAHSILHHHALCCATLLCNRTALPMCIELVSLPS